MGNYFFLWVMGGEMCSRGCEYFGLKKYLKILNCRNYMCFLSFGIIYYGRLFFRVVNYKV